jgi:hypothetical protein
MAKGPEKNTKTRRCTPNCSIGKLQEEEAAKALRLKALVTKMNQKKSSDKSDEI